MGSLVPFQDLNLLPDPNSTTTTQILKTPKIEPKLEPLDSLPPTQQEQIYSNSTPTNFKNPENTPLSLSFEEDNLYSEFYHISELFHTAFAKRLQQKYGDIKVVGPDDSRAIVPVPNPDTHHHFHLSSSSSYVVVSRSYHNNSHRKYPPRSLELVHVTDLGPEDRRYFRYLVRRTRMVYDSLYVLFVVEEEHRHDPDL